MLGDVSARSLVSPIPLEIGVIVSTVDGAPINVFTTEPIHPSGVRGLPFQVWMSEPRIARQQIVGGCVAGRKEGRESIVGIVLSAVILRQRDRASSRRRF